MKASCMTSNSTSFEAIDWCAPKSCTGPITALAGWNFNSAAAQGGRRWGPGIWWGWRGAGMAWSGAGRRLWRPCMQRVRDLRFGSGKGSSRDSRSKALTLWSVRRALYNRLFMATFSYIARDPAGQKIQGKLAGATAQAVLAELQSRQLAPVQVQEVRDQPRMQRRIS